MLKDADDQGMCDDDDEADNDEHEDEHEADGSEGSERTAGRPEGGTTPAVPETLPQKETPQDPTLETMPQEEAPQETTPETMPPGRRIDDVPVSGSKRVN